jgi:DNA polymerase-3 subunit delta'
MAGNEMTAAAANFAPWQQRAYAHATDALDNGRMGHALLVCGPARLGKLAVAQRLAQRLLCRDRGADGEPCGRCRSCQLFVAGSHPDYSLVSFVSNKEGTRLRTEIVIEQIRELSGKLSLTPQYGGAQVAIIDPADAINHAACNALLKTLEEPQPGRFLWLVAADPTRLPATIRSRCQKLEFRLPAHDEALAWLRTQGHDAATAGEALDAARGHPGLAAAWLRDGGLALRREVATDLALEHTARLTDPRRTRTLANWFDMANRTRALLGTTVRSDLAIAELLLAWRTGSGTDAQAAGQGRR